MATLKISDLSVGDWVNVMTEKLTSLVFCEEIEIARGYIHSQIKGIREDGFIAVETSDSRYTLVDIGCIGPIPITAEILEKNGWSNDGMYAFLRIDEHHHLEYYYHEHRLRKYYCGVDEWQNHAKVNDITFAVHCYSVHSLQHALRLAGVDKEINL